MFRKSTDLPPLPSGKLSAPKKIAPTVISADMRILGNLISEGMVDFDGQIDGNIRCATLVLRPNALVNGEIHAESVMVHGVVKGLIRAATVKLCATSKVEGIVLHESLSMEDGATLEGKCKRMDKESAAVPESETVEDTEYAPAAAPIKPLEALRLIAG